MKHFLFAAICISRLLAQDLAAEGYETPGPLPSADLLPASVLSCPLWKIAPLAQADGVLATYQLSGPRGVEFITGTQCLLIRTRELKAILALDRLNKSEEFGKALVKSGADKVESVKDVVKDPAGTIQRLPEGAGPPTHAIRYYRKSWTRPREPLLAAPLSSTSPASSWGVALAQPSRS